MYTNLALLGPGFGLDLVLDRGQKLIDALSSLIGVLTVPDRHGAIFGFAVAQHEHVGNLLQLCVADFEIDLLAAVVELGANAGVLESIEDFRGVFDVAVGDWQNDGLHRSEPNRERARVALDQDSEKSLDG